ncbi:MAG: hypothetical protein ACE5EO_03980 [Candidatus Krumholzibacteriia bacterium]
MGKSSRRPRPPVTESGGRQRDRRRRFICFFLIFAAAFVSVGYYRQHGGNGYPLDDSWIHLTFARNVASGAGFGANPHEPTPGATSPLWVLFLAPGFLFGAAHAVWPWVSSACFLGTAGVLCAALVGVLRRVTSRGGDAPAARPGASPDWPAVACGLAVVWCGPLVWSAAGAMEVPLFVSLVVAALLIYARAANPGWRSGLAWGGAVGLAALARPEGLLLAGVLAAVSLSRMRRSSVVDAASGLAACAVVYSPSVVFCLSTSGRIFPNTFYAKTTALVAGAPDAAFLGGAVQFFAGAAPVALAGFVLGIAVLGWMLGRRRPVHAVVAVAAFAAGLPLAYAAMGRTFLFAGLAGNFGRYLYPVFPPAMVLGFWGAAWIVDAAPRRWVHGAMRAATIAALVAIAVEALDRADLYRHNVRDINSMQVTMAKRLRDKLPSGSLVAANDVGALAYFTGFRVLDLEGIISTPTLDALAKAGPRGRERAHYELLRTQRPAALVVFPEWFAGPLGRLGDAAHPIEAIENRRNITSGGSRLVAFEIDWE